MRIAGCGLIFLFFTVQGFSYRWKIEQNCAQWKYWILFLQLLQEELQNTMKSCEEILLSLGKHCRNLELLQHYEQAEGTVQQRLLHSAEALSDPTMKEVAQRFAQRFGTASVEIQLDSFHAMEQQCQQELERRREKAGREGSLVVSLSVLGGAAVSILLL